jgi:DHA1 family bicyclomycin/chloramphenicol resistance-like MFS transporter
VTDPVSPSPAASPRRRLTPQLILLLSLLSAFAPLSIDMYLPAWPAIAGDLGARRAEIQLTLSAFLLAFGFGQIVYGPLGDRFGRRPVLLIGVGFYVLTSFACALAETPTQLIALRALQGLAAGACPAMARAMVRDLAQRDAAARAFSWIMTATSLAPMIAPLIGAQALALGGWRTIFAVLVGFGLVAALAAAFGAKESLRPEMRASLNLRSVLVGFGDLLRAREFMAYNVCGALIFAAMFAFLSGSPFVFIERYGMSANAYSLVFAANVATMTAGTFLNRWLVGRWGAPRTLRRATLIPAATGACLVALGVVEHATGRLGLMPFLPFVLVQIGALSMIAPNASACALHPYPHKAGAASSLLGVSAFGSGAIAGALVGHALGATPSILPMALAMGLCGIGGALALRLLAPRGG